jgi:hypothetical protein
MIDQLGHAWTVNMKLTHYPRLEWQVESLEHMVYALRPFIEEEDAMVRQRHLARHRNLAAADQTDIGNGCDAAPDRAGW